MTALDSRKEQTALVAAFLLFAAGLFVVGPAEASRTATDARSSLASSSSRELASLELSLLEPLASVDAAPRFGFAEDLGLLDVEARPCGFELFGGVETSRCALTYARNNPLKYVDPDGRAWQPPQWLNTGASVAAGFLPVAGEIQDATIALTGYDPVTSERMDNRDRVISGVALFVPLVGGAFLSKAIGRGIENEARILEALGETKNTRKVVSAEGKAIPDFVNATTVGEIKDTKRVSDTVQVRIERDAARASGKEHVVVTGTNTKVSGTLERKGTTIIRRHDLGPEKP